MNLNELQLNKLNLDLLATEARVLLPEETLINLILVYENNLLLRLRSSMGSLTAAEVEMSGAVPTAGTVPNGDAARPISRDDDPNHLPDLPGLIKYSINNNKDGGRKQTRNDKRLVLPKIPNSVVTTAEIASKAPEVGVNVASLQGHKATVTQCHVLPVIVITSSLDSSLRLWDRETFQFIVELKCLNPVHRFLCLDRGKHNRKLLILAATDNGRLVTWKVKIGKGLRARCTNSLSMHLPNPIRALDVSSDGRHLATGCCFEMIDVLSEGRKQMSIRGTVKIWDMENVIQVALHPKANYQIIRHSQMRTMHQIVRSARQGGTSAKDRDFGIRALTFSPDGSILAVGFGTPENSHDQMASRMVALCATASLEVIWLQDSLSYNVHDLAFASMKYNNELDPDSPKSFDLYVSTERSLERLAIRVVDKQASSVSLKSAEVETVWSKTFSVPHSGLALSGNDEWLASSLDSTPVLRDPATGRDLETFTGHSKCVASVQFSSDNGQLFSTSSDNDVKVWSSAFSGFVQKKRRVVKKNKQTQTDLYYSD